MHDHRDGAAGVLAGKDTPGPELWMAHGRLGKPAEESAPLEARQGFQERMHATIGSAFGP